MLSTVKKVIVFPVPSRAVTNQALPGRELLNYSLPERVWLVSSRLGMGKIITFFITLLAGKYTATLGVRVTEGERLLLCASKIFRQGHQNSILRNSQWHSATLYDTDFRHGLPLVISITSCAFYFTSSYTIDNSLELSISPLLSSS